MESHQIILLKRKSNTIEIIFDHKLKGKSRELYLPVSKYKGLVLEQFGCSTHTALDFGFT